MWRFFWYNFEWWSERGRFDGGSGSDDDDDDAYLRACVYEYEYEYDLHLDGSSSHSVSISILPEEKKKNKKSNAYCIYFNRRIETACGNMRAMPLWTSNSTLFSDERLQSVLWLIQQFAVYSEGLLLPLLLLRLATCQEKHKKKYIINNTTVESYI